MISPRLSLSLSSLFSRSLLSIRVGMAMAMAAMQCSAVLLVASWNGRWREEYNNNMIIFLREKTKRIRVLGNWRSEREGLQ